MVAAIEKLILAGEIAVRAGQIAKALRKNGSNEAAMVLEKECNAQCKNIVRSVTRRRTASNRARNRTRNAGGRFS